MMVTEFILYVADQEKSKLFYEKLLAISPSLHVPGMTEFDLSPNCKLGLMPENGIAKILNNKTPHLKRLGRYSRLHCRFRWAYYCFCGVKIKLVYLEERIKHNYERS